MFNQLTIFDFLDKHLTVEDFKKFKKDDVLTLHVDIYGQVKVWKNHIFKGLESIDSVNEGIYYRLNTIDIDIGGSGCSISLKNIYAAFKQ